MTQTLDQFAAAQLRAEAARRDLSAVDIAGRIGVRVEWVRRRMKGDVPMSIRDLERFAAALELPPARFLPLERAA